jgi:putative membrane protein
MKIRALAIISALALPTVALADDNAPRPTPPATDTRTDSDTNKTDSAKNTPGTTPDTTNTPDTTMRSDTTKADTGNANDSNKTAKLSDGDAKIVAHLHHVNQMEIELGKLAQKTGTTAVKNYGATLVTDHQSADKDLTTFAKSHKLATIPADKPQTDADKQDHKDMQSKMANLKNLKGADFDREFLNMMATGHDKELANIDTAIGGATDADLQTLLKGVKPVLQRHADQARDLQKNAPQASSTPSTPSKSSTPPASPTSPTTSDKSMH